jgi:Cu/Ag efflux pump CusA
VAGATIIAAAAALPFMSSSLLPTFKEEQLLIRWDGPPGTSLPEMKRITALASRELRTVSGVRDVGAHVGRAVASDLSANANTAEIWVSIDGSADYDATVAAINAVVDGYPGLSPNVGTFSNERVSELLADGPRGDVVVRVYGEEPKVLRTQAERVRQTIASVDGTADVTVEQPPDEPTVEVEVDLAAAEARGVKPGDVRRAAATLLGGLVVGNLFEQQKVFEVMVWGTPETRHSLTSISQLLVDTPDGRHVRLGEVADVRIAPNPAVIERHAVSRFLDVVASVSGRDRGSVVRDVENRVGEMRFPLEFHTELQARQGQPWGRLVGLGFAAAVGILLLFQACFGSWRLAGLCFVTFPAAVTGGLLAVVVADGGVLSFGSSIALLAVFGLAVRHGMLLIDRFRQLAVERGGDVDPALVMEGARERLVPTLTTALAAALALLPFVVMGGSAGLELAQPAALVLVAGLVTSTALNLYLVPALYLRFGAGRAREQPFEDLVADLAPAPKAPVPTATPAVEAGTSDPGS